MESGAIVVAQNMGAHFYEGGNFLRRSLEGGISPLQMRFWGYTSLGRFWGFKKGGLGVF